MEMNPILEGLRSGEVKVEYGAAGWKALTEIGS